MADTQITKPALVAAPADYLVADAAELELKAVHASMDGSGAGAAWLPCVTIKSDSGHVVARGLDTAVSVAAGGSADVSWFPGVKPQAAAAGGTGAPDWILLFGVNTTVTSLPIGDNDHGKFTNGTQISNNLGNWSFTLDGSGRVKMVTTTMLGIFEASCNYAWDTPGFTATFSTEVDLTPSAPPIVDAADVITTAARSGGTITGFTRATAAPTDFAVILGLGGGASDTFTPFWFWIKRWPQ